MWTTCSREWMKCRLNMGWDVTMIWMRCTQEMDPRPPSSVVEDAAKKLGALTSDENYEKVVDSAQHPLEPRKGSSIWSCVKFISVPDLWKILVRIRIRGSVPYLVPYLCSDYRIRILFFTSVTFTTPTMNKNTLFSQRFLLSRHCLFEGAFTSFFKDKKS
jgi:hypothetical protein